MSTDYLNAKKAMMDYPLSDMQARRLYLLYKKADYLTSPQEDNELAYLKEQLNTLCEDSIMEHTHEPQPKGGLSDLLKHED